MLAGQMYSLGIPARTFVFLLALLSYGAVVAQTPQSPETALPKRDFKHSGRITIRTIGKKENMKTMSLSWMPIPSPKGKKLALNVSALFSYTGDVPVLSNSIILRFEATHWDPVFPERPEVTFSYAGESVLIPWLGSQKSGMGAAVSAWSSGEAFKKGKDSLLVDIPSETLVRILGAQKVNVRVGKLEFQLTEENLEGLRDLLSRGE